jgi:hypothetical protein
MLYMHRITRINVYKFSTNAIIVFQIFLISVWIHGCRTQGTGVICMSSTMVKIYKISGMVRVLDSCPGKLGSQRSRLFDLFSE